LKRSASSDSEKFRKIQSALTTSYACGPKTRKKYTSRDRNHNEDVEAFLKIFRIKKKREITVETTQQFVISSRPQGPAGNWCHVCGDQVGMVSTEQAAVMIGVSSRTIYQCVESGQIHFADTPEGLLLICLKSLSEMDSKRRLP